MSRGGAGRNERTLGVGARKGETEGGGRNVWDCREGEMYGGSSAGCGGKTSSFLSQNTSNLLTSKFPVEGACRVWGTMKVHYQFRI